MRIIIEETDQNSDNKRRSAVECEKDDVSIDTALDMIVRCLLSYGYDKSVIGEYLLKLEIQANNSAPNTESEE